jgi:virginiamycin B lyase
VQQWCCWALITGQNAPLGVTAYGSYIYWTNLEGGTINRARLDGADPQTLITDTGANPTGVAVSP